MEITLNANMVRAAMLIPANEKVRYIIQSVHITTKGEIYSTDGRTLFQGEGVIISGDLLEKDLILPYIKIPKKVKYLKLQVDDDKGTIQVDMYDKGMVCNSQILKMIDGRYPDVNSFKYSADDCNIVEAKSLCVNPDFLTLAGKMFPLSNGIRIESFRKGDVGSLCFIVESMGQTADKNGDILEPETWKLLIMPILDSKYEDD